MKLSRLSLIICMVSISFSVSLSQNQNSAIPPLRPNQNSGRIKKIYDKAKDETTVVLTPMTVSEIPGTVQASFPGEGGTRRLPAATLQMMAYFSFPGKAVVTPKYVVIGFICLSQGEYKYANDRQLVVTADGTAMDLGEMKLADSRVDSNIQLRDVTFYRETLELSVKIDEFVRITDAAKIRVRLGKTEFDLPNNQREAIRTLASKMKDHQ